MGYLSEDVTSSRKKNLQSAPPSPARYEASRWRDPLVITGCLVGMGILLLWLSIPWDTKLAWFTHPIRFERVGQVPAETVAGVTLLSYLAPLTAIAWLAAPWILRRLERSPSVRSPLGVLPTPSGGIRLAVLALTIIAIVPRAMRMGESLWYDEIAAMLSFSIHGPGPALGNYYALSNHVLHSALASVMVEANGGADEFILRTPAFLAGIACVPAMFMLGRTVDGDRFGVLAAAVIALMPVAVLESANARGYSMMMLFTILATWQVLRIADGRRSGPFWYALAVTLGCWSHLAFAFVPLGHAVLALSWLARKHRRASGWRLSAALLLGGISTLLVVSPILPDLIGLRREFAASDGNEPSLFGVEGQQALLQLGGSWFWWAALPGILIAAVGITESSRWPRLRIATIAAAAGLFVTFTLLFAGGGWVYARFLLFLVPVATLLIAAGIRGLAYLPNRPGPAIIAATLLACCWLTDLTTRAERQPIRKAVDHLIASTPPGTSVWSIGLGDDVADYYASGRDLTLHSVSGLGVGLDSETLLRGPDHVLMLYPDLVTADVRDLLANSGFTENARFPGWQDWGQGDVLILDRD